MRSAVSFLFVTFALLRAETKTVDHPTDLSYYFDEHTIYWGNGTRFHFTDIFAGKDGQGVWYAANEFEAAEHGGTHMDAPYHFNKKG